MTDTKQLAGLLRGAGNTYAALNMPDNAKECHTAADELEAREADWWAATDGIQIHFGVRDPRPEDDGANWCGRTEVNEYINDRLNDEPGVKPLQLIGLFTTPPAPQVPDALQQPVDDVSSNYIRGWNDCRAAMLAAAPQPDGTDVPEKSADSEFVENSLNQAVDAIAKGASVTLRAHVPDGYALFPKSVIFDREAAKALAFMAGNPDDEKEFSELSLWIGNAKDEDTGEETHGLHATLVEYPEEGCVTIIQFAAAPQHDGGEE